MNATLQARLAERVGTETRYRDIWCAGREVSPETTSALFGLFGLAAPTEEQAARVPRELEAARWAAPAFARLAGALGAARRRRAG